MIKIVAAILAALALLSATVMHAQPRYDEPQLTLQVSPVTGYIQQEVIQHVLLISAHPFESLDLHLAEVEGAESIMLVKPKLRRYLSYGVEGYAYEAVRALLPKRSGQLSIPAVSIRGSYRKQNEELPFERHGEPVALTVLPIPTTLDVNKWLVANRLEMTEQWSGRIDELRVGDSIRRTINIDASGVSAEQLIAPTMAATAGVTVLSNVPTRATQITPSGLKSQLVQHFDIRIDTTDAIRLAPAVLHWWHGPQGVARRSSTADWRVEPLPRNPEQVIDAAVAKSRQQRSQYRSYLQAMVIGGAVLFLLIAAWLLHSRPGRAVANARLRLQLIFSKTNTEAAHAVGRWRAGLHSDSARHQQSALHLSEIDTLWCSSVDTKYNCRVWLTAANRVIGRLNQQVRERRLSSLTAKLSAIFGKARPLPEIQNNT